jgi:sodium-dependent dicarboxylate transporter 2/3/5
MVLGVAYAATIGGMGSLIGTPPNALFAAFMADSYGIEISFARWLLVGLPVIFILLPVMWLVVSLLFLRGLRDETSHSISPPPAFNPAMRRVALIAGLAALAWLLRPLMMSIWPELGLSDGGIAIVAAIALFVTSSGEGDGAPLLTWHEAAAIRWDVLMLFGGGLALAAGIEASGLSQALAESAIQGEAWPVLALLVVVVIGVVLVGELASNTAMAAVLFPIAGATLGGTGSPPLELLLPLALATSIGFMLPVATPPNAIAFGGGKMVMADMIRAGAILDILAIAIVVPTALVLGRIVFG